MLNTFVSPGARTPISHVITLSSIVDSPVSSNEISFGNGLVTCTSLNVTADTFSTSNSRANGPPSSPVETESVRFSDLAGLVSKRSLKMSIRFPSTLYFML